MKIQSKLLNVLYLSKVYAVSLMKLEFTILVISLLMHLSSIFIKGIETNSLEIFAGLNMIFLFVTSLIVIGRFSLGKDEALYFRKSYAPHKNAPNSSTQRSKSEEEVVTVFEEEEEKIVFHADGEYETVQVEPDPVVEEAEKILQTEKDDFQKVSEQLSEYNLEELPNSEFKKVQVELTVIETDNGAYNLSGVTYSREKGTDGYTDWEKGLPISSITSDTFAEMRAKLITTLTEVKAWHISHVEPELTKA